MFDDHGLVIEQVYPFHKYYFNAQSAIRNFGNYEQKPENFWQWMKYVHPDFLDMKIKLGRHIPVPFPYRYMVQQPNGKIKWLEQVLYLKRLSDGSIVRTGYQIDITNIMNFREQKLITKFMGKTLERYLLNFRKTSLNKDVESFNVPFLREVLKEMNYKC